MPLPMWFVVLKMMMSSTYAGEVNPKRILNTINTELILADLESIEKRLQRVQKQSKSDKTAAIELKCFRKIKNAFK